MSLRVGGVVDPPYVLPCVFSTSKPCRLKEGLNIDVFRQVAKIAGFNNLSFVKIPYYVGGLGNKTSDVGDWDNIMGYLARDQIDVCASYMTVSEKDLTYADYSLPVTDIEFGLMVGIVGKSSSSTQFFLRSYSLPVWLCIAFTILTIIAIKWFLWKNWLQTARTIASLTFVIAVFVLTKAYKGNLFRFRVATSRTRMAFDSFPTFIKGLEDKSAVLLDIRAGWRHSLERIGNKHLKRIDSLIREDGGRVEVGEWGSLIRRLTTNSSLGLFTTTDSYRYAKTEYCNLAFNSDSMMVYFLFPKNSSIVSRFHFAMYSKFMAVTDYHQPMLRDYISGYLCPDPDHAISTHPQRPLQLKEYKLVFAVYACAILIAIAIFMLEIYPAYKSNLHKMIRIVIV